MLPFRAIALSTLAVLTACTGVQKSDLSGTVSLRFAQAPTSVGTFTNAEVVPGELIVQFKSGVSFQSASALSFAGVSLQAVRPLGLDNTVLYQMAGASSQQTLQAARELSTRADIASVQPNYILRTQRTPNDASFANQWNLPALNLPTAWDIETGETNPVTIAVVDTGILWRQDDAAASHPDLAGKVLPGYDFISDKNIANDDSGRDPDPYDDGNVGSPEDRSDYHGSHVAGIAAAASNNALGVSGVNWGAKILPVRVIGVGGGTLSDIMDGMLWAAGLEVAGVPANPNPAQIINLSLGGAFRCAEVPALQSVINRIRSEKGASVVVAAGNNGSNAAFFTPASCSGVITVGATDAEGKRPSYSNYGSRIDLMAPGGTPTNGVLSLGKDDVQNQFSYVRQAGTSMAAPHVAGLLALLKSHKPELSQEGMLELLKANSKPLTPANCGTGLTSADCGAGIPDAEAALKSGATVQPPSFSLALETSSLSAKAGESAKTKLNLTRLNGFAAGLEFVLLNPPAGITGQFGTPNNQGSLEQNQLALRLELTVQTASSVAPNTYSLTVQATGGGLTRTVGLTLQVTATAPEQPKLTVAGTVLTACYWSVELEGCDSAKSKEIRIPEGITSAAFRVSELEPGEYYLIGWKDADNNKRLSVGDYQGAFYRNSEMALVRAGERGLEISLDILQGVDRASTKERKVYQAVWRYLGLQ